MKRILALIVAVLLTACLSACDLDSTLGSKIDTDEAMPHYLPK